MKEKMEIDQATFGLAASMTDRAFDLIQDGWVKGTMRTVVDGAPDKFCILGALEEAFKEVFPGQSNNYYGNHPAVEMACAFIIDEAMTQYAFRRGWSNGKVASPGEIPGFNDAGERQQEQVLSVLREAATRLWDISVANEPVIPTFEFSKWADVGVTAEVQKQYLHAVLA